MNWLNMAKSLQSAVSQGVEVYNTVQQLRTTFDSTNSSGMPTYKFEKASNLNLEPLEIGGSFNLYTDKAQKIYYLVVAIENLIIFKSEDVVIVKEIQSRFNNLLPLYWEAASNHIVEKFLILVLEKPDWKDIHMACYLCLPAYVENICRKNDPLSIVNCATSSEGCFPLQLTTEKGFVNLTKLLLDFGADIQKCDLEGRNAIHWAAKTPISTEVIKLLIQRKTPNLIPALAKIDEEEFTPLQIAYKVGNLEAMNLFLSIQPTCGRNHSTTLFKILTINPRCLELLLEKDPELILMQEEPNLILHNSFNRDILKIIADRTPFALEYRRRTTSQTPLHSAVQRNNLDNALQLLSYGSQPMCEDSNGDTPLHIAVRNGNALIVKLLLCFEANIFAKNKKNETPYVLKTTAEVGKILKNVAIWNQRSIDGVSISARKAQNIVDFAQQNSLNYQMSKTKIDRKENSIRLLALDGGGIRGLVLIQILLELEKYLKQLKKAENISLIDSFEWISGTSTGAILALALADGTSLMDCLRLYLKLKDDVFDATVRPYSAENIEKFLQHQFGPKRTMSEIRQSIRVMVTTTKADSNPPELILYRNYSFPSTFTPHDTLAKEVIDPKKVLIWKAARSSSAAPTYFPSVDGYLMDGGLIANNPTLDLLTDLHSFNLNLIMQEKSPKQIACLVSIGTGKLPKTSMKDIDISLPSTFGFQGIGSISKNLNALANLKSILVEQVACSDGQVVERAQAWAHSLNSLFFRLTPQLETEIPLDTKDNEILVKLLWKTKEYINTECFEEVATLINFLNSF